MSIWKIFIFMIWMRSHNIFENFYRTCHLSFDTIFFLNSFSENPFDLIINLTNMLAQNFKTPQFLSVCCVVFTDLYRIIDEIFWKTQLSTETSQFTPSQVLLYVYKIGFHLNDWFLCFFIFLPRVTPTRKPFSRFFRLSIHFLSLFWVLFVWFYSVMFL